MAALIKITVGAATEYMAAESQTGRVVGTEDDTRIPGEGLARVAVAPILQGPGGVRVQAERMSDDTRRDGNITTSLSLGLRALVEGLLGSVAYWAHNHRQERNCCVTCDG